MAKRPNPFAKKNPFTTLEAIQLVAIPPAPETHEGRRPLRSYLAAGSGGGGAGDALAPLGLKPKRIEVERIKIVPHADTPEADEVGEAPAAPATTSAAPSFGKR